MPPISHFALNQWCNPMFLAITTTGQRIYFRAASLAEARAMGRRLFPGAVIVRAAGCAALAA